MGLLPSADQGDYPTCVPSTATLIQQATAGDRVAVDEVLVRFLPELTAFLRLRMGSLLTTQESASDVAQSVCRDVLENANDFEYRGIEPFRRWLFLRAERRLIARARRWKAQRRDVARHATISEAERDEVVNFLTPSRDAMAREELDRFWQRVDALTAEQRSVVALCRGLGLTPSEAAVELGKTANAVRVTLHRALARLAVLEHLDGHRGEA